MLPDLTLSVETTVHNGKEKKRGSGGGETEASGGNFCTTGQAFMLLTAI